MTPSAVEDIVALPARIAAQVMGKIARLETGLVGDIKKLQQHDSAYRLRSGEYRVLFDVVGDTVKVRRVKHRRDAYK